MFNEILNENRNDIGNKAICINADVTADRRGRYIAHFICGKIKIEPSHIHFIACKECLFHIWSKMQYR